MHAAMPRRRRVLSLDGWHRLRVGATPAYLALRGPCISVNIQPWQKDDGAAGPIITDLVALVDTGAGHSCISPRLVSRLGIPASNEIEQFAAGHEPVTVPMFHCKVTVPDLFVVEADLAILSHLAEPTDVVIGCDLLRASRLLIDFTTGRWEFHFRPSSV